MALTKDDKEELKEMIEGSILLALPKADFPACKIESARITQMEKIISQLNVLVVGNGHVEDSLMWKARKNGENIDILVSSLEKIVNPVVEKKDSFSKVVTYFTDKILPSLLTTGILALIAFEVAVRQHLLVLPP